MRDTHRNFALEATITASPAAPGGATIDDSLPRGTTLGRYVLLDRLGTGGMGIVYAAYDPELDRRVALKVLRTAEESQDAPVRNARLLREAQAMARISHPNVIAVHDVGVVGERVFVAMELVDGVTLDTWIAVTERTVADLVAMFAQAGRGLAAAHAKGLVHRDFKPDNVLVGADGRVRVLDFGLAYANDLAADPSTPSADGAPPPGSTPLGADAPSPGGRLRDPLTRAGALMGTPWYMSPEQLAGKRPDARSDQWSFCATMHEALFGEHPYAHPGDANVAALERRIKEGARRDVPVQRLARVPTRVRAIVERGLSIDPAFRFPSMDALVAELEPVAPRSRRVGWWIGAATAVAVLAAGVAARRPDPGAVCDGVGRELDGVWGDARRSDVARAFERSDKSFAAGALRATTRALDSYATAWIAAQKDACLATHARGVQSEELLDLRTQCLAARRAELGALVDVLAKADVDTMQRAPAAARDLSSLEPCQNAALLRAPTRLPDDPVVRGAIERVRDRVARARALDEAGRYAEMLVEATAAVSDAQATGFRPATAEARLLLGRAQLRAGDERDAEVTLMDAALDAEASHDDVVVADAWPAIAQARTGLFALDRADEAVRLAQAALLRLGGERAREAALEGVRCRLDRNRGHYDEAAAHARIAVALLEALGGPNDTRVAGALNDLGLILNQRGKYEEATAVLERALAILEGALGPDHPEIAATSGLLSNSYEYRDDTERALSYAKRSLDVRERAFGPDHVLVAVSLVDLGNAADDAGDYDGAIAAYRRALAIRERQSGPESARVASVLYDLAQVEIRSGAYAAALADAQRAVTVNEKVKGPTHTDVGVSLDALGNALCALGRCREALAAHERAISILRGGFGDDHPDVASVAYALGRDALALHEVAKATASFEQAVAIYAKGAEAPEGERADAELALARVLWDGGGDRARAVSLARGARDLYVRGGKRSGSKLTEVDAWLASHR